MSPGFEVRIETDIDNRANFETATLMMTTIVKYLIGDTGFIADTGGRQGDLVRPLALDQALAGKRAPHILVFQAGGVAGAHGRLAQVEVIAMGVREGGDGDIAIRRGAGGIGDFGDGLQQGQRLELQRIELGGIGFWRHRSV